MTLFNRIPNRYRSVPDVSLQNNDGTYTIITAFRDTTATEDDLNNSRLHRVRGEQTMNDIALDYFDVPELWYVIADANPDIFYPLDVLDKVGEQIKLPSTSNVRIAS